jgi:hypothetical protein
MYAQMDHVTAYRKGKVESGRFKEPLHRRLHVVVGEHFTNAGVATVDGDLLQQKPDIRLIEFLLLRADGFFHWCGDVVRRDEKYFVCFNVRADLNILLQCTSVHESLSLNALYFEMAYNGLSSYPIQWNYPLRRALEHGIASEWTPSSFSTTRANIILGVNCFIGGGAPAL